jgi:hypothetical protein
MRSIAGKWFNANEQHILDWYLPHVEDFEYRLSRQWQDLNRGMWKVWRGNLYGASIALNCFHDGVDIHIMNFRGGLQPVDKARTGSRALGRVVVVPDRRPTSTDQLRQRISQRPSHIDSAGGVDCRPTGRLADGEETAYTLDSTRRTDVAPRALRAN